jgi:transcriptional regulator with XRE-family HTH domain
MLHRKRYSPVNGSHLRSLRQSRGWTQVEFGRLAGYSERLIRKAESGGNLLLETIEDLATALSQTNEVVSSESLIKAKGVRHAPVGDALPANDSPRRTPDGDHDAA